MNYRLIFDGEQAEATREKVLPLLGDLVSSSEVFDPGKPSDFKPEEPLILYLTDGQLKELLPRLTGSGVVLAILPHPEASEACVATGVARTLEKAIAHIRGAREPVKMDLLYCNGMPIFNIMVIGQTFKLTSEELPGEKRSGIKRIFPVIRLFNIEPFRVEIDLPNDKKIKTAVTGIVVSEHKKSSVLTRLALEDSSVNDGKMHAFFISPRSVVEMLYYGIRSLWNKNRLPPFAAHVKTTAISLTFPAGPRELLVDRKKLSAQNIDLRVEKDQLNIIPGSYFEMPDLSRGSGEIFKVRALPKGEAAQALAESKLPFIKRASSEEFKELFQILRDNARLKNSYLVLMVLSTVLATFGLFANSSPVVIGAMILAPLMAPIISLSMGTLRHDKKLITDSFKTIFAGLGLSLVFAVLITWLTPIQSAGSEILARTRPNLLDLGIAAVSGIAGAYAYAREEVAKTLAGVAIAVALIPPLAVISIGLGWGNPQIFLGATLLLGTNLAGMLLAASITFMLLGFSPLKLATRGMLISLVLVLIVSIPLALGFNQMVYEHKVKKQLEGLKAENAIIRGVSVQSLYPMKLSIRIVSQRPLNSYEIDQIKELVETRLQRTTEIEMVMAISR
ncbi:MAG: TIGR00341 family protein [Cyclobacteriaceae bacterium]